jgi:septal ring factor EnvC (AmiA/AmiB activator)
MSKVGMTGRVNRFRVLSLVMSLLALTGWGTFAYAAHSSATVQHQLREEMSQVRQELTQLKGSQEQLLAERDQAQAQLAAAQEEVAALTKRLEEAQEKVSQTGSVRPPAASEKSARSPTRTKGRSR